MDAPGSFSKKHYISFLPSLPPYAYLIGSTVKLIPPSLNFKKEKSKKELLSKTWIPITTGTYQKDQSWA